MDKWRHRATARGVFPLRFGRQIASEPAGIGERVLERDVHHRLVLAATDVAARALGMTPVGARNPLPPRIGAAKMLTGARRHKHGGTPGEAVCGDARNVVDRRRALRARDMARGIDEARELCIGHFVAIDPEGVDAHLVHGALLGIAVVGPHPEAPGAHGDEAGAVGFAVLRGGEARRHAVIGFAQPLAGLHRCGHRAQRDGQHGVEQVTGSHQCPRSSSGCCCSRDARPTPRTRRRRSRRRSAGTRRPFP